MLAVESHRTAQNVAQLCPIGVIMRVLALLHRHWRE